jgi:ABC-2 type transport system ATP-binding protein
MPQPVPADETRSTPVAIEHMTKRYDATVAVDDLSFTVERGQIHGLIGPNGAGKTTTLECLLGLRTPDAGRVRLFGMDPHRQHQEVFRRVGAYLQEDAGLYRRIRVGEALQLYRSFATDPEDTEALAADFQLTDKMRASYGSLSGGQKARLHLALATIGRPQLLILDEPTAGLDPIGRREVWALIREAASTRQLTVLVSTHHLDEAERYCNSVSMLDHGRLVLHGAPQQLLAINGFGTHVEVQGANLPTDLSASARWISTRRDTTELVFADDDTVSRVYRWAADTGNQHHIRVRAASLPDLFLAVTQEGSLR